ncbi:hypothetical protein F4703DRAFT_1882772 [Phycomyces blakesleeanus]
MNLGQMRESLNRKDDELIDLQEKLDKEHKKELAEYETHIERAKNNEVELATLKQQNQELQTEVDELKDAMTRETAQHESAEANLVHLQRMAAQDSNACSEAKVEMEALTIQLEELSEKANSWESRWQMCHQEKEALEAELKTLKNEGSLTSSYDNRRAEMELKDANRQLHVRSDKVKELQAKTNALESQVTDLESKHKVQLDEVHKALLQKDKEIEGLRSAAGKGSFGSGGKTREIGLSEEGDADDDKQALAVLENQNQRLAAEAMELEHTAISQKAENDALKSQLERQLDAFGTLRGELSTVRQRQLDAEARLEKEKADLKREKAELESIVHRLRSEYETHLDQLWKQHEELRGHHEQELDSGRLALDTAQDRLLQNGLSPVSENGFEWVVSERVESESESESEEESRLEFKSPALGRLPPLERPAFFEFMETPRCSGCQSEVIDI